MIAGTCLPDDRWPPEPLAAWQADHNCEFLHGFPQCMGAAARGEYHCTCDGVSTEHHRKCETLAWEAHERRRGKPCADCLFRSKDPEEAFEIQCLIDSDEPMFCHVAMPVRFTNGDPGHGDYSPRRENLYPPCAGARRAREAAKKKADRFSVRRGALGLLRGVGK